MALLLAVWLAPVYAQPAADLPAAHSAARAAVQAVFPRQNSSEDDDEESFGLDGTEPLPNFGEYGLGLWRSGQPNRDGLRELKARGLKTVLNLRSKVGDEEKDELARLGVAIKSVPMNGLLLPRFTELDRAVGVLRDPANRPVLVHCRYGKDRTGVTVAAYRVAIDGWTPDAAIAEAKRFHCCMQTYVGLKTYLKKFAARYRP